MEAVANRLLNWMTQLEAQVDSLLAEHSGIWLWNPPGSVLITGRPFAWSDLEPAGRLLQSSILDEYGRWCELTMAMLAGSAKSIIRDLASAQEHIREVIDQSDRTFYESVGDARQGARDHFTEVRRALEPFQRSGTGPPLLVPDTNALLFEPRLEEWAFAGIPEFQLVLLPTVLGELDDLKVNYRRDSVREKAETLIRQVKGYRARGQLNVGVHLRKGRSTIRAVAVEPRRDAALSWMSWDSADDRILASVLEIMRNAPAQAVGLVTRDLNLQNKADFARVPYVEPPSQ